MTSRISVGGSEAIGKELLAVHAAMFRFHGWADDEARAMVYAFEGDPVVAAAKQATQPPPTAQQQQQQPAPQCTTAADTAALALACEWAPKVASSAARAADSVRERVARQEREYEAARRQAVAVLADDRAVALAVVARDARALDDCFAARAAELRRDCALQAAEATKILAPPVTP
jgi:hypothetical protein